MKTARQHTTSGASAPAPSHHPTSSSVATEKGHRSHRSHAVAMDQGLRGRRAAAWLRMWDGSNRAARTHILEAFLSLHAHSTSDAVATDLGDAAPLFFARITAWLRLSYCKLRSLPTAAALGGGGAAGTSQPNKAPTTAALADGSPTAAATPNEAEMTAKHGEKTARMDRPSSLWLMVESLAVFLRGATYVTQLVESGMAATLTDCLERGASAAYAATYVPLTGDEKRSVLRLLLYVANAGRVYREMICDEEGLLSLLAVMQCERDEGVAGLLTELFVLLGKGNPRLAPLVQNGLFRLIVSHYEGLGATDGDHTSSAVQASSLTQERQHGVAAEVDDTVMVLEAARALRGLQLHKETHYFSSCLQRSAAGLRGSHANGRAPSGRMLDLAGAEFGDGGGVGDGARSSSTGVPEVDEVPVVCYFPDCVARESIGFGTESGGGSSSGGAPSRFTSYAHNPRFAPVSAKELVATLFALTLDDNTRFRVEGSELLVMVSRNVELMTRVLNRALDVLDDDMLVIADAEDAAAVARRHRHQLSCGRVAVQVMLTRPATMYRQRTMMDLIALRSAHMSLVKYLRLTDLGDSAAVVDGCRALQMIARASEEAQASRMQQRHTAVRFAEESVTANAHHRSGHGAPAPTSAILKMGQVIRDAVGASLYQVLLHEQLTEEECFAMLRAARSSATRAAVW